MTDKIRYIGTSTRPNASGLNGREVVAVFGDVEKLGETKVGSLQNAFSRAAKPNVTDTGVIILGIDQVKANIDKMDAGEMPVSVEALRTGLHAIEHENERRKSSPLATISERVVARSM